MVPLKKDIKEIFFKIGGYFGGFHKVILKNNGSDIAVCAYHTEWGHEADLCSIKPFNKDDWNNLILFLTEKIQIWKWKKEYINNNVCDGTEWCLCFVYSDDSTDRIDGSNDFPSLFDRLEEKFEGIYKETLNNKALLSIQQKYAYMFQEIKGVSDLLKKSYDEATGDCLPYYLPPIECLHEATSCESTVIPVREILESDKMKDARSVLTVALGKNQAGDPVLGDIAKMPHLLIGGEVGSGKSVSIRAMITSLLYRAKPDEVKLIIIDLKSVEFQCYNGLPHLLIPVINDPRKATAALAWAIAEMMERYDQFAERRVRNVDSYNASLHEYEKPMPRIVIIIDELADMMMLYGKTVEEYICRLAQLARASGIHLVIASQVMREDIITKLIKANIPSRIAFKTACEADSCIILDRGGSEKLNNKGEMLYFPTGTFVPFQVQGCFISDDEVDRLVAFIKDTSVSRYDQDVLKTIEEVSSEIKLEESDPMRITRNITENREKKKLITKEEWEQIKRETLNSSQPPESQKSMPKKTIKRKKCPACGHYLKRIMYGYPTKETEELVRNNPDSYMLGGCCCWGDERDPQFYCSECNQHYYHDLKPVVWDEQKKEVCPQCGSDDLAEIRYGRQIWTDELKQLLDSKKAVLGGCMISTDEPMPKWECNQCGKWFGVSDTYYLLKAIKEKKNPKR